MMFTQSFTRSLRLASCFGAAAVALLASAPSHAGEEHSKRAVAITSQSAGDGEPKTIELRVDNGVITARVNGQEIPADRIHAENGQVTLYDEHGNRLSADSFFIQTGDEGLGEGLNTRWRMLQGDVGVAQPAPKTMIGITMGDVGPALASHLNVKPEDVCMITGVYHGLPAQVAGLQEYDVIVAIAGSTPANSEALASAITAVQPDDTIALTVVHQGTRKQVNVIVAAYDQSLMHDAAFLGSTPPPNVQWLRNLDWQNLDHASLADPRMLELLVTPQEDGGMFRVMPKIIVEGSHADPTFVPEDDARLHEHLERLNSRMQELESRLERMLQKLEHQNSGGR